MIEFNEEDVYRIDGRSIVFDNLIDLPTYKFALREDLKDNKEFLPTRAEPNAAGWDVRAAFEDKQPITLRPFEKKLIPLGFRAFCPKGWWLELKPRSSTFAKKSLHCLYGTVDSDYEGMMFLSCQYIPEKASDPMRAQFLTINFGDALGQLIPIRLRSMNIEEVSNEEYDKLCQERQGQRGSGGFGSTSK